jgi:hypothetical protein
MKTGAPKPWRRQTVVQLTIPRSELRLRPDLRSQRSGERRLSHRPPLETLSGSKFAVHYVGPASASFRSPGVKGAVS